MRNLFLIAALSCVPAVSIPALATQAGSPATYLICSARVTDPFSGLNDRVTVTFDNFPSGSIPGTPGIITRNKFIYSGPHSSPSTDGMLIGMQYTIDTLNGTINAHYGTSGGPDEHLIQLVPVDHARYKLSYRGPNGFMFTAENASCFLNPLR